MALLIRFKIKNAHIFSKQLSWQRVSLNIFLLLLILQLLVDPVKGLAVTGLILELEAGGLVVIWVRILEVVPLVVVLRLIPHSVNVLFTVTAFLNWGNVPALQVKVVTLITWVQQILEFYLLVGASQTLVLLFVFIMRLLVVLEGCSSHGTRRDICL